MSENVKFIVTEINKLLGRNYSIIGFNTLNTEDLLQILCSVLMKIQQQDDPDSDIKLNSPEENSVYILTALRILNYQPDVDPITFRQGLVRGDVEIIHPILKWLLMHIDVVQKRAYLSQFLVKVEIPSEYLGDSETSLLYEQYLSLIDRFKTVHKEREIGKKNVETAVELATDLQAMTKEKEVLTARIAKIKLKAEPALHLLDACKLLRTEKDKERNLISQKEQEEDTISDLQNSLQRVERELYSLKRNSTGLTPQILIQHLTGEVTVQSAIVKEKLPSELNAKKNRLRALSIVKEYSYLGADKITTMRNNLDVISKAIQDLVESKISKNDIDKVGPFRQQAAAVGNMKRNALERLEKIESSLEELQSRLKEKQDYSKILLETSIPRAEELKRYINRLKTKSSLYKRCKAEKAGLKAESGVLQRTVTILDEQIIHSYSVNITPKVIIPENYTLDNALATNTQLSHSILALRTNLAPVIKDMKSLRQTARETDERYRKACKSHNTVEMSIKNTTSDLLLETKRLKEKLSQDTKDKKQLQQKITKIKLIEEQLRNEAETNNNLNNVGQTFKRELQNMIMVEEETLRNLNKEQEKIKEYIVQYENRTQQWNTIIS
ncbi:Intraflagellar transport protein 81 like protein [Cyphomyrmex costatus]|uniref:Intraflagellar transport protein 81 like protein n=1 Tax=Cyphomyrmex costatus TaxID=456900 RepID=A0A195CCH5_9HYME|nr:Intraflagellar transport protein 81 like protein [Cyphomyrmex costatus]